MTATYIYDVNGTEFYANEAFGQEWKKAKELATTEHCGIWRAVVKGENIRHEFYAKGGCFLNEKFYTNERIKIF